MNFTHQKRPYKAIALQYQDDNSEEVIALLLKYGAKPNRHGKSVMIRFEQGKIETIGYGDWVRIGENDKIKIYDNDGFLAQYVDLEV